MKKILIAVLLVFTTCLYADYTTPNTSLSWNLNDLVTNSGGTVTFSGGSYFVNDTLTISSSDTLKILNNAVLKLAYNIVFKIRGTVIVNPPDSVNITSIDTAQKFYEMRIDTSAATSLQKVIFEYSFNGLRIFDCSPIINNCTIRNNCILNTATTAPAINLFRSNAVISNCRIYRNYKVAIGGGANISNAPQILNNQIYENNYANANASQINLGASGSSTTIIRGNVITGMFTNAGGIATLAAGTLGIVIENNIIKKNRYGIAIQSTGNAIIRNNVIDSNNIQGSPNLGGSGINLLGSGVTALISKNLIRGNLWGVTVQSRANPMLGDLSNSDTNYIGMNQIYHNHNSGIFYDFYNNTINPIKAENNYWGSNNVDTVEAHIFHQPDNDSGFVDYLPLWTPVGITQSGSEVPNTFLLQNAYPNPFNPSTTIRFSIPESGSSQVNASLKVYDISGRLVAVLLNSRLSAGNYTVNFDASGLASGLYFYTLSAEKFSETKKMILIK